MKINRIINTCKISKPLFYSFVLVIFFCCTPILKNVIGYFLTWILILTVILGKFDSQAYKKNSVIVVSTLLYVAVVLVYKLSGVSSAHFGYYLVQMRFYLIVLLLPLVPRDYTQPLAKKLWWMLMFIMLFNIADNIRLSILYPEINIIRHSLDESFLSSINAGTGSFYTFSLFFFLVSFFVYLNTELRKIKLFSLFAAAITAIYICWFSLKASVFMFFFLSIVLVYYAKKAQNRKLFLGITILSGIIIVLIVDVFSDEIIDYIIMLSPNERLTMRLVTIVNDDASEAHEATITGRTTLYMLSVKTWLTNVTTFFLGIGDHYDTLNPEKTGIGQHADFLDVLARYGLVGGSLVFVMLRSCFKYILSLFDNKYRLQIGTIFFVYFLCGFSKHIFEAGIGCVVFILLPLSAIILKSNKQNYNKYKL